jgi:hypothetical protein
VTRFKPGILLTLISIVAMLACDKLYDEPGNSGVVHDDAPGCDDHEAPPHPYLSCVEPFPTDPPEIDPECVSGCGYQVRPDGVAHTICEVTCESDLDCAVWDAGDSVMTCAGGRCFWYCDEENPCPSELECISRGDLSPGDAPYWGECWAPSAPMP